MNIENTSAIVTGASSGLGAALASELARQGARVVAIGRRAAPLADVVERIRRDGGEIHALPADVADKDAVYAIAGAAAALAGPVDLLIHNASALGPTPLRLLLDTDCEDLRSRRRAHGAQSSRGQQPRAEGGYPGTSAGVTRGPRATRSKGTLQVGPDRWSCASAAMSKP